MSDPANGTTGPFRGPLEAGAFPDRLRARVVTPGERPRVHGYDVEGDLAHHYDFVTLFILYLTGSLPSPAASSAARVALMCVSPTSVAHASVHAAVLARLCGGTARSIFGASAVGLAEQAHFELSTYGDLFEWLAHPSRAFPEAHRVASDQEQEAVQRLLDLLPQGYHLPIMTERPSRLALVLAILRDAGFRRSEQFEAAFAFARLPSALAEAFAERSTNFAHYPINLPQIAYHEPESKR